MQSALASAGAQKAICKPLRPTTYKRALIAARSCASAPETSTSREHLALAVASFLTSTIVAVTSASPAFADDAIAVAISSTPAETASALEAVIEGADAVDASAEVEVAGVAEAPPPSVTPASEPGAFFRESLVVEVVDASSEELPVPAPAPAVEAEGVSETVLVSNPSVVDEPVIEEVPIASSPTPTDAAVPNPDLQPVDLQPQAEAEAEAEAEAALPEEAEAVVVAAPEVLAVEAVPEITAVAASGSETTELTSSQPVEAVLAEQSAPVDELTAAAAVAGETGAGEESVVAAAEEPVPVPAAVGGVSEDVEASSLATVVETVVPELPTIPEPVAAAEATEPAAAAAAAAASVSSESTAAATAATTGGGLDLQALFAGASAAGSSGEGPSAETLTYGVLGATAVSFIATFLVAPRFKEAFKEPVDWREMHGVLAAKGVKTVTAAEAFAKAKKGAVILDVRLADSYARRAAAPSVNVPLYQPIADWDLASIIRRAGFAFFGIFGTELNETFIAEVAAKVPKNKEVIVMCETGGSIDNKPGTQFGFQSRSLKALYYLQQAGYGKVLHMKGGLGDWQREGLPLADGSNNAKELELVSSNTSSSRSRK
ncbi:hypothetical protein VaNZ11_006169 [Volvox africanus]|uniref:Rhodanese domain-containing protein n=1 Tax=Volvox africanus TaxID=51714 RepID=A0ABQ5S082_9CHLO|nr:hypothetical protein VaNZ11_006169 [Volvox africanus]